MRHYILCICALAFAGCCGLPDIGPQADGYSGPVAKRAAQSSEAVHTGCSATLGIECGGESIVGGKIDFINPAPILKGVRDLLGLFGVGVFRAESARVEADPCGTPGACSVPEAR